MTLITKAARHAAVALTLAAGVAAATPADAQYRGGFVKLRTFAVSDRLDQDVVSLPGRARFSQIKICVSRRAVRFFDLDVVFRNGGRQDVGVRRVIGPGECTRNIDLRGRKRRNIDYIVLKYTSFRKVGRQPFVTVFGR